MESQQKHREAIKMRTTPTGDKALEYFETRLLIKAYAKILAENDDLSYDGMLNRTDRLSELADKCRELWGDYGFREIK
jgi:hypothetical protein